MPLLAGSPVSISSASSARSLLNSAAAGSAVSLGEDSELPSPSELLMGKRRESSSYFTIPAGTKIAREGKNNGALCTPVGGEKRWDLCTTDSRTRAVKTNGDVREVIDGGHTRERQREAPLQERLNETLPINQKIIKVKSKSAQRKSAGKITKATIRRTTQAQSKLEGTKVTKPRGQKSGKENETRTKKTQNGKAVLPLIDEPLGLERAETRRLDWTPLRSRTVPLPELEHGEQGIINTQQANHTSFTSLISRFDYASDLGAQVAVGQVASGQNAPPPSKKRKIGLVQVAAPARPPAVIAAKKAKAPAKKARTITGLMTESFRHIDQLSVGSPSLMDTFLGDQPQVVDGQNAGADTALSTGASNKSGKGRTKARVARSKPVVKPKSRLLAPEHAIEATESQELLFGTSSQLVREDSPSFIRDLQHALRESEASASQQEADPEEADEVQSNKKNLWCAAARDLEGSLLEASVVDLTTPLRFGSRRVSGISTGAFQPTTPLLAPPSAATDGAENIDEAEANGIVNPPMLLQVDSNVALREDDPQLPASLPRSMAEAACKVRPRSRSPVKKKIPATEEDVSAPKTKKPRKSDDAASTAPSKKKVKDMKDFNNWTVPELTKKIKVYGFKPVKGKANMVALLEKCAASTSERQGASNAETSTKTAKVLSPHFEETQTVDGASESAAVAKKRGRPQKTKTAEDVDAEGSTTKTRKLPAKAVPSVLQELPPDVLSSQPIPTPALTEPELLIAMTRAITTFPPTHDPKNFTWHEKMLLYDPIVLEDLTVWLNTEGLGKVDVDEEVWPSLVRTWCEDRGICCLWRENLRGGARKRY